MSRKANVTFQDMSYRDVGPDVLPQRFSFECPRRPGERCWGLLLTGGPENLRRTPGGPALWDFEGDRAAPTMKPSINCLSEVVRNGKRMKAAGCGWHGYIRKGEIVDA